MAMLKKEPVVELCIPVRIDKWLWAVRICKTRMVAKDLCERQKVSIDGQKVKPSRTVQAGQLIVLRREGIDWVYKVIKPIGMRVGAPEAVQCREDLTPPEDLERLKTIRNFQLARRSGEGRPTKKERRAMDRMFEETE